MGGSYPARLGAITTASPSTTTVDPTWAVVVIVTRFFSGGSFMRGFNQRRLSPMTVVTTPTEELGPVGERLCARGVNGQCAGTTVPIGGASLLEASLEVRFEVTENLVLAVFWDNGLVSSAPLGPGVDFARDFYSALGFGVRYKTPLGPLRADVAFRLPFVGGPLDTSSNPQNASVPVTSGCFFNLGASGSTTYAGAPDSVCSFHLSIGEAF
jgi:translocation and assembly module TamA